MKNLIPGIRKIIILVSLTMKIVVINKIYPPKNDRYLDDDKEKTTTFSNFVFVDVNPFQYLSRKIY